MNRGSRSVNSRGRMFQDRSFVMNDLSGSTIDEVRVVENGAGVASLMP